MLVTSLLLARRGVAAAFERLYCERIPEARACLKPTHTHRRACRPKWNCERLWDSGILPIPHPSGPASRAPPSSLPATAFHDGHWESRAGARTGKQDINGQRSAHPPIVSPASLLSPPPSLEMAPRNVTAVPDEVSLYLCRQCRDEGAKPRNYRPNWLL